MSTIKKSRFNITIPYAKNRKVIFNTKSMKACFLDSTEYELYLSNKVDKITEKAFMANGIYVQESVDELYSLYMDRQYSNNKKEELNIWIFTTLKCNARCEYCFEQIQDKYDMNEKTANSIVEYIKKRSKGFSKINLCWFGGEPLLNTDVIDLISNRLSHELRDVVIMSSVVTNGSLINEKILTKMKSVWKTKSVQITLDGMLDAYDNVKKYICKEHNFELVISNIRLLLAEGIKVNIRLNYSGENFGTLMQLIDYLGDNFSNNAFVSCYVYPIWSIENKGQLLYKSNVKSDEKLLKLYEEIVNKQLALLDKIINLKYIKSHCMACNKNNFSVLPNGNIIKCANLPEICIGNVESNLCNQAVIDEWSEPTIDNECSRCVYLPLCQGGCIASKYGNMRKCFIYKEIMPQLLKMIFKRDVTKISAVKTGGE